PLCLHRGIGRLCRNIKTKGEKKLQRMPLPALGTQRIIQGNGTTVGTIISLQCPAKHRLVGSEMMCVMDSNSTYWKGETYCKPLSRYEDFGFRVAVLASIVSSAIILLMSMAFVTCCLLDCIREDEKKKEESRSHYHHKGRNNNNNNSQDNVFTLCDPPHPATCDSEQVCR
uniref:Sushi domain-containing protein n=1 Tax=Takifugu rubripes TaxID=31033 RepID=H2THA2_TAKRU